MANTNIWKQFQGLLPKHSRIIGTVISHNNNGSSTVALREGSQVTADGQVVAVGQKALVENRVVIREVPDLPLYRVEV